MPQCHRMAYSNQHQCRALYMIFDGFTILMYYVLKVYMYYGKEHWWSLVLPWPSVAKKGLGQSGMFLKESYYPHTRLIL